MNRKKWTTEDGNDEDNSSEYNDEMNRTKKKICIVLAAVAEAGQRTGMVDIAEIDEMTLFSEAYHLHKISMCKKGRNENKYCSFVQNEKNRQRTNKFHVVEQLLEYCWRGFGRILAHHSIH